MEALEVASHARDGSRSRLLVEGAPEIFEATAAVMRQWPFAQRRSEVG
jgi:hypothetical protein